MSQNPAQQLINFGQSVWYDNISREILKNGELKRFIEQWGVRGLTSNPSIFDAALSKGSDYDEQINSLKGKGLSTEQVFEELAIEDIAAAADLLAPIYLSSNGDDGFVSIEVSPLLARDADATVSEARRLFAKLDRPNIMIKIPGTAEGMPAIRTCLEEGININITLLFSVENYIEVAQTYCEALKSRAAQGQAIDGIRSVASFFVSRVDSIVDKKLKEIIGKSQQENPALAEKAQALLGRFGIANSQVAYKNFQEIFLSESFSELKNLGAAVQRPLWASTSTKDPAYPDVLYIDRLIGAHTVNTIPHKTLEAFIDHGQAIESLTDGIDQANLVSQQLEEVGVDVAGCLQTLQVEGVQKFIESFEALNATLESKLD